MQLKIGTTRASELLARAIDQDPSQLSFCDDGFIWHNREQNVSKKPDKLVTHKSKSNTREAKAKAKVAIIFSLSCNPKPSK